MTYDPLTGAGWDTDAARAAWSQSMERTRRERNCLRWQLRDIRDVPRWTFFDFGTWTGQVAIGSDGFHWTTYSYDTGDVLHEGVTTSLYEAYQSVEQNKIVKQAG